MTGCANVCTNSCKGSCNQTCTNACATACSAYVPSCDDCALGGCTGLCAGSCLSKCDYGCRNATNTPAYDELSSIADLISAVDGNALINLITEEINRRSLSLTNMGNANAGTTVSASTINNARTNLSRMNKTVNAASSGTTAQKTFFQTYVDAIRNLYETMVAQP